MIFIYNLSKIVYVDRIINNIITIKNYTNKRYIFVAKSNCYGCNNIVQYIDKYVDSYAVFNLEEAIKLRNYTDKEILVFCTNINEFPEYIRYDLTVNFYKYNDIVNIYNKLQLKNQSVKLNIAIDTGMNRFGVKNINEFIKIINFIEDKNCINLLGIYTHLSKNSLLNYNNQIKQFNEFYNEIKNYNISISLLSSSYIDFDIKNYYKNESIRIGIANYIKTIENTTNCIAIYSKILDIKYLNKGETLGYDNSFIATKLTKIAIVSGGYYDGINSNLSGYYLKINDNYCKIVGKICMDLFFVDITNINCDMNDLVEIISLEDDNLSIQNMADYLGLSKQEVLVNFSGRTKTIYKNI